MNMEQSEKLLAAYLLDELDAATRGELEAALSADAALRDRLGDMRMALKLVHQGLEEEDKPQLSEARRLALLAAVAQPARQAQPQTTPAGPAEKTTVSWWRRQHKINLFGKKNQSTAQRAKVRPGRPMLSALTAVAASIMLIVGVAAFMASFGRRNEAAEPNMSAVGRGVFMDDVSGEVLAFNAAAAKPAQPGSGDRIGGDTYFKEVVISDGTKLAKTQFDTSYTDGRRSTLTSPKLTLFNGQEAYVSVEGMKRAYVNDTLGSGESKAGQFKGDTILVGGVAMDSPKLGTIHKEEVADSIWDASIPKGGKASGPNATPSADSYSKSGAGALTISGKTGIMSPASTPPVIVADRTPAGAAPHGPAQSSQLPGGTPARPAEKAAQEKVPDGGALALGGMKDSMGERQAREPQDKMNDTEKLRSLGRDKELALARANTRNELDSPIDMDAQKSRLGASSDEEITAGKGKAVEGISLRETEIPWESELQYPKNWREQNARNEKPSVVAGEKVAQDKEKYNEKDLVSRSPDVSGPVVALDPKNSKDDAAYKEAARMKALAEGNVGQSRSLPDAVLLDAEPLALAINQKGEKKDVAKTPANHSAEGEATIRRDSDAHFYKLYNSAPTTPAATTAPATAAGQTSGQLYSRANATESDGKDAASKQGLPAASTFREVPVNPWVMTERDRFSTFASDVDTASYTLCRSYLRAGYLPPRGAVRMEEFVNAFDYNYPRQGKGVFNIFAEAAPSPFAEPGEGTVLLKVGVQGRVIGREGRKSAHLIFVVDTSGSMAKSDRLPLIQNAIKMLADALDPNDQITLITYNRQASLVLESVPASRKEQIVAACDNMRSGGPTNLLAGLEAGYSLARREFVAGRINRVILCTDGAANIGQTDSQAILDGVAEYRKQGITLTVAGFGQGGYNDELLETLAKKGDGSYMFIDTIGQAKESLVEKMNAALQTIAFDSRIQVEFNPDRVRRYRLIGYEKRQIADEDFRNDTIDAAEVGSGQSATALYELELKTAETQRPQDLLGTVFVRYRNAEGRQIEEISRRIEVRDMRPMSVQSNPRFYLAASAARFAEILRESSNVKNGNYQQVQRILQDVCKTLPLDDKASELLQLVQKAKDAPRAP